MIKVMLVSEDTGEETIFGEVGPADAWWSIPLPPCPDCGGKVEWAEWGQVPGSRRCDQCKQFFRLRTIGTEDDDIGWLLQQKASDHRHLNRIVILNRGKENEWTGPLRDFVICNELDKSYVDQVSAALEKGEVWHGGGGASEDWTLDLCPENRE
jgi:hypothetical protein